MANGKPYAPLGEVMDGFASRRPYNVRGPHRIAGYVKDQEGVFPSGTAVSKWMYGLSTPKAEHLQAFARAFGLTTREEVQLAYAAYFPKESAA